MSYEELNVDITVESRGKALIYRFRGSLEIATSRTVREALVGAVESGIYTVIVDLTQLEFLDSAGLGVLIGAQRRAAERSVRLRIVIAEGPIERLLHITGLTRVFAVYRTVNDALAGNSPLTFRP